MAKVIVSATDYTFNAAGQTVTFGPSYTGLELPYVLLITNVTDNVVIYQFNKPGYGGSLAGLVLTLDFNTTLMSNTDELQIIADIPVSANTVSITDGVDTADVVPLAGSDALAVAVVDGSGNQITGFGGGVQYTEGDTDATLTGTISMMEGPANTAIPLSGTAADGLLVNLGTNNDVTVTGTVTATDGGGSLTVDAVSLPLPTGASTSANQSTIIGHLDGVEGLLTTIDADTSNISTKIDSIAGTVAGTELQVDVVSLPNEGQQTMANSVSVAIASDQTSIPVSDGGGALTVDGSVSITGTPTVALDSGSLSALESITVQNGSGAAAVNIQDGGNSITVDGSVSVSGAVDTELPPAATLADNAANPSAPAVGAFNMVFDGTTWDRAPGTTTDGLLVNLGANNDVTVTGTVTANLAAGTNNIGDVDVLSVPAPLSTTGGGTEASALRVTIANDSTGVVSVDDNGGSLTIDGSVSITGTPTVALDAASLSALEAITVQNGAGASAVNIQDGGNSITVDGTITANLAAGTNYAGKVRLTDGTTDGEIVPLAGYNAQAVAIVDGSGTQITSFGGGTQYTEGDTDASITGTAMLWEDAGDTLRAVSAANPFPVNVVSGSTSGTEYTEGATDASITGTAMLMEGAGDTLLPVPGTTADGLLVNLGANNDVTVTGSVSLNAGTNNIGDVDVLSVPAPLSTTGGGTEAAALRVTIANDSTGVVSIDDNGGSLTVDGSVSISGTPTVEIGATSLSALESITVQNGAGGSAVNIQDGGNSITIDATSLPLPTGASTSAKQDTMIASLANLEGPVGSDGAAAKTTLMQVGGTDGANAQILSTNSSGHVNIADGGNSITVDGTVTITDAGGSITVDGTLAGDVAHDTTDSGNPVKIGAKAIAHGTNPTAVAASDRTDLYANRHGVLFTMGGHPNIITRTVYISDATGAQTDASIVGTINAGTKVAVTSVAVTVDSAVTATGGVAVKLGFGATTIPADSSTGANGILLDHKGIAAGSGLVLGSGAGLLGIGADGEELRLTCEDPVGGGLSVTFSYYTIES